MQKDIKITLAAARVNAGYTQEEIARMMHISKATIVNWEKGKVPIGIPELRMLCDLYCFPTDCIFLPEKSTKSRQ